MVLPPVFIGTLREHYIVLFGAAGAIATVTGFIGAWLGARMAARHAARVAVERMDSHRTGRPEVEELRLLSQSVEAVAIEVERIAEAQRFVAKVLLERAEPKLPATPRRDPGVITPH